VGYAALMTLRLDEQAVDAGLRDRRVIEQVEIQAKYQGYIERQQEEVARNLASEETRFPAGFDFTTISGLSREVQQKLAEQRPQTLGQASRIPGVTPAAISILLVCLKRRQGERPDRTAPGSRHESGGAAAEGLAILGIALPESGQSKLLAYVALLEKWNRTFQLTAIKDPAQAVSHHLLDSLAILPFVDAPTCSTSAVAAACPAFRWRSPARSCRSSCSTAIRRKRLSCNRWRSSWG
jgi:hypothetical protein